MPISRSHLGPIAHRVRATRETLQVARQRKLLRTSNPLQAAYIGALGDANLGDEAMLEAARVLLDGCNLTPLLPAWQEQRLWRRGASGVAHFRSAVLGGGTLISPYWIEWARTALDLELPIWALGTGAGSSGFGDPTEVFLQEWEPLLRKFTFVGVRGPRSEAALNDMGIPCEVVGDLALALTPDVRPEQKRNAIAVNVSLPPGVAWGENEYACLRELEEVIRYFYNTGMEILPVAMHRSDIPALDALLTKALGHTLPIALPGNAEEYFFILERCTATIAVRLHAAILSCCVGVPPLMLGYRDKCLDFMESMELADYHIPLGAAVAGEVESKARQLLDLPPQFGVDIWRRACLWRAKLRDYVGRARGAGLC